MTTFNSDDVFKPLLAKIENGDIKTTRHLTKELVSLEETLNVSTLKLLIAFRKWLLKKNVNLLTDYGVVEISKAVDNNQE